MNGRNAGRLRRNSYPNRPTVFWISCFTEPRSGSSANHRYQNMSAHKPHAALSSRVGSSERLGRKKRASHLTQRNGRIPIAWRRYFSTAPCRCDRNTSELPQCGQSRLESAFIPYTTSPIAVFKDLKAALFATCLTMLEHVRRPARCGSSCQAFHLNHRAARPLTIRFGMCVNRDASWNYALPEPTKYGKNQEHRPSSTSVANEKRT
jgi:hypothetical protein